MTAGSDGNTEQVPVPQEHSHAEWSNTDTPHERELRAASRARSPAAPFECRQQDSQRGRDQEQDQGPNSIDQGTE